VYWEKFSRGTVVVWSELELCSTLGSVSDVSLLVRAAFSCTGKKFTLGTGVVWSSQGMSVELGQA
jgi:hypothetical protein